MVNPSRNSTWKDRRDLGIAKERALQRLHLNLAVRKVHNWKPHRWATNRQAGGKPANTFT